ncbi:hypothetical protein PG988_013544 [Apiospora saccharicola]
MAVLGSSTAHARMEKAAERRLLRRLDFRVLPILWLLYLVSFVDRSNIGNAKIQGMDQELQLTGQRYNIALFVFNIGYLAVMMFCWGLTVIGCGLTRSWAGLVVCRLLEGMAESAFVPGAAYLIGSYYRRDDFASYFFIVPFPEGSTFLMPEDKDLLLARLRDDRDDVAHEDRLPARRLLDFLRDLKIWAAVVIYLGAAENANSITSFQPTILRGLGYDAAAAQVRTIPVYLAAAVYSIAMAYAAERLGQRYLFCMVGFGTIAAGLAVQIAQPRTSPGVRYMGLFFMTAGAYLVMPLAVVLIAVNVGKGYKRTVALGAIVCFGNAGSFIGTNVYLRREAHLPHRLQHGARALRRRHAGGDGIVRGVLGANRRRDEKRDALAGCCRNAVLSIWGSGIQISDIAHRWSFSTAVSSPYPGLVAAAVLDAETEQVHAGRAPACHVSYATHDVAHLPHLGGLGAPPSFAAGGLSIEAVSALPARTIMGAKADMLARDVPSTTRSSTYKRWYRRHQQEQAARRAADSSDSKLTRAQTPIPTPKAATTMPRRRPAAPGQTNDLMEGPASYTHHADSHLAVRCSINRRPARTLWTRWTRTPDNNKTNNTKKVKSVRAKRMISTAELGKAMAAQQYSVAAAAPAVTSAAPPPPAVSSKAPSSGKGSGSESSNSDSGSEDEDKKKKTQKSSKPPAPTAAPTASLPAPAAGGPGYHGLRRSSPSPVVAAPAVSSSQRPRQEEDSDCESEEEDDKEDKKKKEKEGDKDSRSHPRPPPPAVVSGSASASAPVVKAPAITSSAAAPAHAIWQCGSEVVQGSQDGDQRAPGQASSSGAPAAPGVTSGPGGVPVVTPASPSATGARRRRFAGVWTPRNGTGAGYVLVPDQVRHRGAVGYRVGSGGHGGGCHRRTGVDASPDTAFNVFPVPPISEIES